MQTNFSIVSENLARTFGAAEAIVNVERQRRYSFAEYHRLTNKIVNMMCDRLHLRRGDVWLAILNNDNLSLMSFFTACKGEATACYTNTTDSLADQERQIGQVKPAVVFIEAELLHSHYPLLARLGVKVVSMDPPAADFPGVLDFWQLLEGVGEANPDIVHDDRAECMVLRFTGGTTGPAKAVMYSIDNWLAGKDAVLALADQPLTAGSRFLHFGVLSHASGIMFFPVLFKGGCTITINDRSLLTWCRTVEKERVTGSLMVPAVLYRLLDSEEARAADLSSLKIMVYGAAPMSPGKMKQLRERFGNIFVQAYASSEHPAVATSLAMADHAPLADGSERHLASAGKVVPGGELQIRDAAGRSVKQGEDGEIWMKSRATCLGYLGNPQKTAEEFQDGFWKSGDVGRMDENGFVYVIDRIKDTVVANNVNVYPTQVEAAICGHPAVSICAVVGIPEDGAAGESVHAEVMVRPGACLDVAELRRFLNDRLPSHCLPKTIAVTGQLPMSPVGKVLRRAVREACLQRNQMTKA